jgi:hypothetical protein
VKLFGSADPRFTRIAHCALGLTFVSGWRKRKIPEIRPNFNKTIDFQRLAKMKNCRLGEICMYKITPEFP